MPGMKTTAEYSYEIREASMRSLRIKVSTPLTPGRSYWLSWDGQQLAEGEHMAALRARAPQVVSELRSHLATRWTSKAITEAMASFGRKN